MIRLRLFAVILACLLSQPVLANVIFDVTVNYSFGANTATYSFSMEFASASPLPKEDRDLLPFRDFINEKLVVNGVTFTLVSDFTAPRLEFDGAFVRFDEQNQFDATAVPNLGSCTTRNQTNAGILLDCGGTSGNFVAVGSQTIVEQSASAVPLPPVPLLLGLGLAGLFVSRRATKTERLPLAA